MNASKTSCRFNEPKITFKGLSGYEFTPINFNDCTSSVVMKQLNDQC